MQLPKFLICTNSEIPQTLILSTEYPYAIGRVWLFKSEEECLEFVKPRWACRIEGYNIVVEYSGCLHTLRPNHKPPLKEMADFFLKERIERKRGYYRRYKSEGGVR